MGQWITLQTAAGQVQAWQAAPAAAPRGGIVVIQEIFGVNAHVRSVADRFADEGYAVLAPAFFDLEEPGLELDYDKPGVARGLALVNGIGFDKSLEVVEAAAAALAPAGKVGTVGYCWGGTVALLSAIRLGLPSVSYYGGRNTHFLDERPAAPVMFHFGGQDTGISAEAVQQHRDKLPQMETHVYASAGHAFNRDVDPHVYDADSARLAYERTLAFFARHLG